MNLTEHSFIDRLIVNADKGLRTVFGKPEVTGRADPAAGLPDPVLTVEEQRRSEGLMRVNHTGEVCAQALYQGQALTARDADIRNAMARSAMEENDHLEWCGTRISELGGHKSHLNPFWYLGSFGIGIAAGLAGDKWSLGFVAETEHQVVRHLEDHLGRLSESDNKSRAILAQMKNDELHHATVAIESGAAELPRAIRKMMTLQSRVMTGIAYWI